MTDQLNVIAKIKPHTENLGAARNAICAIVDRTRAEPGCVTFRLSENAKDGSLHLYEEWRDEAALEAHHQQPYTKAVFEAYKDWLVEEPDIIHLRPVC